MKVRQGWEDAVFVGYFGVWDRDLWSVSNSNYSRMVVYVCLNAVACVAAERKVLRGTQARDEGEERQHGRHPTGV